MHSQVLQGESLSTLVLLRTVVQVSQPLKWLWILQEQVIPLLLVMEPIKKRFYLTVIIQIKNLF